jgi:signal transduction histidine kinase
LKRLYQVRQTNFKERFYTLYKLGRFAFSAGLLVLLLSLYSIGSTKSVVDPYSLLVLAIYSVVSLLLFVLSNRPHFFEFLLDELFIFLLVLRVSFSYAFFSLFLFFPVFFSTFFLDFAYGFTTFVVAVVLQLSYFLIVFGGLNFTSLMQLFINGVALCFITLAAYKLKGRLEAQEAYIKSLEREREEAELYKRLYEISANLAHELKNPLASIRGAVELLSEGKQNPKLIEILRRETQRLDSIMRDFLNLARPSTDDLVEIPVKATLEEIASTLSTSGKEVVVEGEEVVLRSSLKGLRSALDNLLRNAVQWAKSKVLVKVGREKGWLVVEVEDDGPGVPLSERDRVFEPFFSKRREGSGLGLSIVRKFAIDSGGFVFVEDGKRLKGARFVLKLPLKRGSGESSDT